jgi:ComF family protein
MSYPHRVFNWLIELVFPFQCVECRRFVTRGYLCKQCFNSLPIKKQYECIGCQRPTPLGKTCTFCKDDWMVDQLLVVSDFKNKKIAGALRFYKYRFLKELAQPITLLTFKYLDHIAKRDHFSLIQRNPLLISVPLSKTRENWRGFNQSEIIARSTARHYRLDFGFGLSRVRQNTPQAELEDRSERLLNVSGVYVPINVEVFKNRSVVIVDDVCTTGATFNECAKVLKAAGANYIIALAIARG